MKVLIVCSKNSGKIAPFITEQVESLRSLGIEIDYFTIVGKGILGYLRNYKLLQLAIKNFHPDIIHAHYGLSGLLANLQRRIPVVTTYHGSDINEPKVYPFSRLCMMLSKKNVFVLTPKSRSTELTPKPKGDFKNAVIPCGVDINLFKPMDKQEARTSLGLDGNKKYVLFAGAFDNRVKNSGLAIQAVSLLNDNNIVLLELKGYSRQQVVELMNAVDSVLMTSFSEGSPQFIKEAMACNCPVVAVSVGDVSQVIESVEGCFLTTYVAEDVAEKINMVLEFGQRTKGRERLMELKLDLESVAERVRNVYKGAVSSKQ
jgi:glycosyltransferase involved in cell wall biosynthesis